MALATAVFGQASPQTQASVAAPAASVSPAVGPSSSPSNDIADRIEQRIQKRLKGHHGIVINGDETGGTKINSDDIPDIVVPIVAVTMFTIFGAPVLIVAVIMYFGFSRNRMTHRTVRMLAEKGQPIPPALLAPPTPAVRQRSDMRRGVVLVMVGLGLMVFLGAVNDWEGGAWAVGIIPFLIGVGYLVVWKLEGKNVSSPPPIP